MDKKSIRIIELAKKFEFETSRNLSKLVQIKSLSCGEKEVQLEFKKQLENAGAVKVSIDGLGNVIGQLGNGSRTLAFDGHIDTVDTGNESNWNFNPYSGEIKNGFVHGRGTVDQKGGLASMVSALKIMKEVGIPDDLKVYFIASVIEEDSDGLCWKYMVEEKGIKPDAVVITEPTNLNIYRGQRGRMEIQVSFNGLSSHGSAPERGKNAIYLASKAALEIEKLNECLISDEFLGKGTVTISEFKSSSPSLCAVADFAQLHLDRRLTWGETKDSAIGELTEILKSMEANIVVPYYEETAYTGLKYGMEKYYPTWKMDENHPVITRGIETYKQLFNTDPLVDKWTFSTNGVTINGLYGIPIIGFGPGNEIMAHAPNERVPVSDLVSASAFYAAYAHSF